MGSVGRENSDSQRCDHGLVLNYSFADKGTARSFVSNVQVDAGAPRYRKQGGHTSSISWARTGYRKISEILDWVNICLHGEYPLTGIFSAHFHCHPLALCGDPFGYLIATQVESVNKTRGSRLRLLSVRFQSLFSKQGRICFASTR